MKPVYFFRKALFVAAALLAGAACSDDPVEETNPQPGPGPEEPPIVQTKGIETIAASVSQAAEGGFEFLWPEGARLAATSGNEVFYYTLTEGAGTATGLFALDQADEEEEHNAPKLPLTVCYPADATAIPDRQHYTEGGGIDPAAIMLSAKADDAEDEDPEDESTETGTLAVTLTRAYATLNLRLKGDVTVSAISVTTAKEAAALAGEAHTVTLSCDEGVALDAIQERDFRVAIAPGSHDLTIRIRSTDGRVKIEKTAETLVCEAGTEQVVTLELQTPVEDFTSAPYKVGDYYFDGEAEGVIVEIDPTGSKGKIIALHDAAEELAWGPGDIITYAHDEQYGVPNMATIAALDETYAAYPAFRACADMGEGWYLPAQHEIQNIRKILDAVNPTLGWRGGNEIEVESIYWSSSEADQFPDAMAFAADMETPGMFGIQKIQPLRVRAMREVGELPEARFKVGALYEAEGKKGIIFWVSKDDTYAKIISLNETTAEWGPTGTATGARDEYDGEKNLAAVKTLDATLTVYPAFRNCADEGEGWYLPSQSELASIARMHTALNTQIAAAGGTELQAAYYWSSTELSADADNSAQAIQMGTGTQLASSKNVSRNVRAITYVGDRPTEAKHYAVGDPYEINDEVIGIVCATTDDGLHGTIIALKNVVEKDRINVMWDHRANSDNYVTIGANDPDDGRVNLVKAQESDPTLADLTAFGLCTALGDGWYLGAVNEMKVLYDNKSVLNAALKANGGTALDNNDYWTSTEGSENSLERATALNMKDGSTSDYRKFMYLLVRPLKRF